MVQQEWLNPEYRLYLHLKASRALHERRQPSKPDATVAKRCGLFNLKQLCSMSQDSFRAERIVLHIPHSSPVIPKGYRDWDTGIMDHIVRWTDWFTDWIFCTAARGDSRIVPVVFPFSRFFCDVERLEDDPLESIGQGIIYTKFSGCSRHISDSERSVLSERFYQAHMTLLRKSLTPTSFLLDCHSFPKDLSSVDVCIGTNNDWSSPSGRILQQITGVFQEHGYTIGINHPYTNSISPIMPFQYPSLMIELNKRLYTDENEELDYESACLAISTIEEVFSAIFSESNI